MSAPVFLPEFSTMPYRGGYLGCYRLFAGHSFRQIPGRNIYPEAWQAAKAAEAYVIAGLNPKIESDKTDQAIELSEFDIWRRQKADEEQAERDRVFGKPSRQIVRNCSGAEVVVVQRKRLVRA